MNGHSMNNFRLTHPKEGIADVNILFKSKSNSCLDWVNLKRLYYSGSNPEEQLHPFYLHIIFSSFTLFMETFILGLKFFRHFLYPKTNTVCNSSCTPTRNYKHIPTERYNYLRTVSLVPTSSLLMSLQCLHLTHAPEKLQDS